MSYVTCNECDSPTDSVTAQAGCPNPGCFLGLGEYRRAYTVWKAERTEYLSDYGFGYNTYALGEQWERTHPRPETQPRGKSHSFRAWEAVA